MKIIRFQKKWYGRKFLQKKCNTPAVLMENFKTANFALGVFRLEKSTCYCLCSYQDSAQERQRLQFSGRKINYFEAISKLLKIVKAPSLRSDKGSVFPPSHKATAGQAPYLTGSKCKLPFTALCEWHLCHFLNDF